MVCEIIKKTAKHFAKAKVAYTANDEKHDFRDLMCR